MVRLIATPSVTDPTVKDLALELGRTPATLRSWMKAEGIAPYIYAGVERGEEGRRHRLVSPAGPRMSRTDQVLHALIAVVPFVSSGGAAGVGVRRGLVRTSGPRRPRLHGPVAHGPGSALG